MRTVITTNPVGEYVTRHHTVSEVGTFTGVPASGHGTYVTGSGSGRPVGRYTQRGSALAVSTRSTRVHHPLGASRC